MDSRVSATGLKSVELDELTTDQIIINNEGLQYLHKYNILLPTITEGYYNLQEELDNIMISNTTQDVELIQLQTKMFKAEGDIITLGTLAGTANANALAAINLANQKSWILFFQKPLRSDISNNVYLDFDTNYFSVDASNNYLTLNTNYWKKDVSNNLYTTSGKVGIGLTNPGTNYKLDVLGNINCGEIYRNGTPISSTLSSFLPLAGGTLTGLLTGTTISATYMSANSFTGSGAAITNLNVSNAATGTLSITRGGIGTTTLSANQILIGNGSTSIIQSSNLTWDTSNNALSATNFIGSGAGLTNINVSNSISGTLAISRGGTGATTFTANQILIGNGTTSILQSQNLTWDNVSTRLGIGKTNPSTTLDVSGNITALGGAINGTLNCTTGIFNGLSTTGNTSVAIPSIGNFGGTGDKLILYPGTPSTYPISLGIENNNALWISSPNLIKFYNKGTNSLLIDVSGNIGIGKTPSVTLDVSGNISSSGNIDCGGGLALNGANAFYNTSSVDAGSYSNTYLTFRPSITNNDWCYVRQVGSDNAFKLAFDFHDDGNDARFCIRNVQSTNSPDTITEVFTVDNGNLTTTGNITSGASSYVYAGDLRLGGWDTGNTIWNGNRNMGLTVNNGYNVNIGLNGGKGGSIMTVNNNAVYINNSSLFITPDTTSKNSITMYCYPTGISNSNGNSNSVNMRVACNTTGFATSDFLNVEVPDGWNGIDTKVTIACSGGANSGYNFSSRIILDGSFGTNASTGTYASTILFQSQNAGGWKNNVVFKTLSDGTTQNGVANNNQ